MTGWQPIKTAPKNCNLLIATPSFPGGVVMAVWHNSTWCGFDAHRYDNATHWQKMPAPPNPTYSKIDYLSWKDLWLRGLINTRTANCLSNESGCEPPLLVHQICKMTDRQLLKIPNFGRVSLKNLDTALLIVNRVRQRK